MWTRVRRGTMHARACIHLHPDGFSVVILVHGLGVSSRYMIPTALELAPYCRVFAVDLPGFGRSCKPAGVLNLTQLADALVAWMDALSIPWAHLVGNSFGCQVLAEAALRYPERVGRLVLQGPTVDPHARTSLQQLFRLLVDAGRDPPSMVLIAVLDYLKTGLPRALKTFKIALDDRIEQKLPRIQTPTLVVRGANDPLVPQRWAEEAAQLLPRGELKVIPGAAHAVNYSAPVEFVRIMRTFLQLRDPRG